MPGQPQVYAVFFQYSDKTLRPLYPHCRVDGACDSTPVKRSVRYGDDVHMLVVADEVTPPGERLVRDVGHGAAYFIRHEDDQNIAD